MTDPMSVRSQLRASTREAHARVDALFAGGFPDAGAYAAYLVGMHHFLGRAWRALPDLGEGLRRLEDDLAAVGAATPALPEPVGLGGDAALGWRYVIDGSSLGARVLLRAARALGHDAARGATFLAHHADGAHWDATCRALEAFPADAARRLDLCAAAGRAFAAAHDALHTALAPDRNALPA